MLRVCVVAMLMLPRTAAAQSAPLNRPVEGPQGFRLLGHAPDHTLATGAMVLTIHPFIDTSKYNLITGNLDGRYLRLSQYFIATYRNSYGDRSWVFALERQWGSRSLWLFDMEIGYRAGIVTGYDERLIGFAEHTPVLPIGGVVGSIRAGPVGGSVFWAYRAIALEASVGCC